MRTRPVTGVLDKSRCARNGKASFLIHGCMAHWGYLCCKRRRVRSPVAKGRHCDLDQKTLHAMTRFSG
eukprot:4062479-Amphidinium_carterae.1